MWNVGPPGRNPVADAKSAGGARCSNPTVWTVMVALLRSSLSVATMSSPYPCDKTSYRDF